MRRSSRDVIQQLLNEMNSIVKDYPERVGRTGATVDALIQGTSFFPGGSGLWRGDCSGGPLPSLFPQAPVMFLGHNFDSESNYERALQKKGEVEKAFWRNLKAFMREARLDPAGCFFTNALMGLKPGSAAGSMPSTPEYRKQCRDFLTVQIEIVEPRAIISLGNDAESERKASGKSHDTGSKIRAAKIMHPSARPRDQLPNHDQWIVDQGRAIMNLAK